MAVFSRKIGRLVAVKALSGPSPKTTQLRPARITAVGAGTNVTCRVLAKTGAETYTNIPRWTRAAPTTTGWVRT